MQGTNFQIKITALDFPPLYVNHDPIDTKFQIHTCQHKCYTPVTIRSFCCNFQTKTLFCHTTHMIVTFKIVQIRSLLLVEMQSALISIHNYGMNKYQYIISTDIKISEMQFYGFLNNLQKNMIYTISIEIYMRSYTAIQSS